MDSFARIMAHPQRGTPHRLSFGKRAMEAMGAAFGDRVDASLEGRMLTLTLNPTGQYRIQFKTRDPVSGPQAPTIAIASVFRGFPESLDSAPRRATAVPGRITVNLDEVLTDDQYRFAAMPSAQLAPMRPEKRKGPRAQFLVTCTTEELADWQRRAEEMGLTIPGFVVHVLRETNLDAITAPTVRKGRRRDNGTPKILKD